MMIETIVAMLIVSIAALYWYARLFPVSWGRLKTACGFQAHTPVPAPSKGCSSCKACSGKSGGCH